MMSPLELRHLRTLLAIKEGGSLTHAALQVNLSQSALSHQIKALESHYGLALFERKAHPLLLTSAGERLWQLGVRVLQEVREAERDLAKLRDGAAGVLRIAVECATCFDWLMPAMDQFREHWPEVELDILSGFHQDPLPLLDLQRADVAIVSEGGSRSDLHYHSLFGYNIVALLGRRHAWRDKPYLTADDFAHETLISYPVPEHMLDLMRTLLLPAGIHPQRRTTELTVGILQLVASRRGIAALPNWSVHGYIERGYVLAKPITEHGLQGQLYAATRRDAPGYVADFIDTIRQVSFANLPGITAL